VGVGVVCWSAVACGAADVCALVVFDEEFLPALLALTWDPSVSFGKSGAPVASNAVGASSVVLTSPPALVVAVVVVAVVVVVVVLLVPPEDDEAGVVEVFDPELPVAPELDVEVDGGGAFQPAGGAGVPPPMLRGAHAGDPTTDPVKMRLTQFLSEKMYTR
jgi:hypothetical protein